MSKCPSCGNYQIQGVGLYNRCNACGFVVVHAKPLTYPDTANSEMIRLSDLVKEQSQEIATLTHKVWELSHELKALKEWKELALPFIKRNLALVNKVADTLTVSPILEDDVKESVRTSAEVLVKLVEAS